MFCDVTDLNYDTKIFDTKVNTHVRMPLCTGLTAGFPCQDCSVLNAAPSSSADRSCVATRTHVAKAKTRSHDPRTVEQLVMLSHFSGPDTI